MHLASCDGGIDDVEHGLLVIARHLIEQAHLLVQADVAELDRLFAFAIAAIPNLYLAAVDQSKTKLFTGFKSAPFVERATGLAFFRSRWYDASTGTWLSPDAAFTIGEETGTAIGSYESAHPWKSSRMVPSTEHSRCTRCRRLRDRSRRRW